MYAHTVLAASACALGIRMAVEGAGLADTVGPFQHSHDHVDCSATINIEARLML